MHKLINKGQGNNSWFLLFLFFSSWHMLLRVSSPWTSLQMLFYCTLKYSTVQHPHWIFTFLLLNCLFSIDEDRVLARHGKPVVQEGLIFVDFFLQVGPPLQDTWTPFWPKPYMKAHFNPLSPISTYNSPNWSNI